MAHVAGSAHWEKLAGAVLENQVSGVEIAQTKHEVIEGQNDEAQSAIVLIIEKV